MLDTNQLEHARPPDGPLLAMLQTMANQAGQELCLPEMALEEHLAHYRNDVAEAQRRRVAAIKDLQRLVSTFNPQRQQETDAADQYAALVAGWWAGKVHDAASDEK